MKYIMCPNCKNRMSKGLFNHLCQKCGNTIRADDTTKPVRDKKK